MVKTLTVKKIHSLFAFFPQEPTGGNDDQTVETAEDEAGLGPRMYVFGLFG